MSVELPVFGPELADCEACELRESCAQRTCLGVRGSKYKPGGLMIIGESPGVTEASQGVPFVGPAGRLFDALLSAAGIDRDECWITNAVLGVPPRTGGKGTQFHDRFPNAVYSCVQRLDAEIAEARPRVIVTLGHAALTAVTGREVERTKLVHFECDGGCDEKRKVGPALVCATGDCGWYALALPPEVMAQSEGVYLEGAEALQTWRDALITQHDGKCPKCEAKITRLRPRMMKCPACEGRKTRETSFITFTHDYGLMGREGAAGAVFKTETLESALERYGTAYIIPTYHPSFCSRPIKAGQKRIGGQYAARAAVAHLEKAKSLLTRDARFDYSVKTTKDAQEVRAWLEARRGRRIATDIETDSDDGPWAVTKITCIGFATADDEEALVVDTRQLCWWRQLRLPSAIALLDVLHLFLEDPEQSKVFHNGGYDRVVITRLWGVQVEGVVGDTMLAHNCCYPDEEHNLAFVAHELTDAPMWKGGRKKVLKSCTHEFSGYADFTALADYNAKDDRLTALCDERFENGLVQLDGQRAAYDLDLDMQTIAVDMELNGLPMSLSRLAVIEGEYQVILDETLSEMRAIVGNDSFVPRGDALTWALYDPSGPLMLPVPGTTPTGKPRVTKDDLLKMATTEPFVQHLLKWRKYDYHLSHYVRSDKLAPGPDGRVHPQWKVTGARTGRWSSEPNFQNWPKTMRTVVVAPPGRRIVGADYSQLEMRILAAACGDPELIRRCAEADENDKLNPEKDPHAFVASMAFGRSYVDTYHRGDEKRCKALRDIAKRVVYGLNYGAGAETVLKAVLDGGYEGPPLSIGLIEKVKLSYFRAFPGVPRWRENVLRLATETQSISSPIIGRHRIFPLGGIDSTVVYNYPIQSGAADIMSTRLRVLFEALPHVDPSAMLIAQVHDAIYAECAEDKAVAVARCIEQSLTVELSIVKGAPSMPYIATAAISDNWKDAA